MVRPLRNNNGAESSEPVPDGLDPTGTFERFLQWLERIGSQQAHHCPAPPPPPQRPTGDKLRPEKFDGVSESGKAEQWLCEMDTMFNALECGEQDMKRLAIFQLTYSATEWWEAEKTSLGDAAIRRMNWDAFKAKLLGKYFP